MNLRLAALVIALVGTLHQDFWFWTDARPLVFGFMPVGLFYHAAFTVACAGLMWWLASRFWPGHLDPSDDQRGSRRG
ncbi:MAG: hypothetical protein AB7F99_19960 [Vicinamibacterales bacterium]